MRVMTKIVNIGCENALNNLMMKIVKQRNLYITRYTAMNLNLQVVYIQKFLNEWNFNLFEGEENKGITY